MEGEPPRSPWRARSSPEFRRLRDPASSRHRGIRPEDHAGLRVYSIRESRGMAVGERREHKVYAAVGSVSSSCHKACLWSLEAIVLRIRSLSRLQVDARGRARSTRLRFGRGLASSRHDPPYLAGYAGTRRTSLALSPTRTASAISSRLKRSQTRSQITRRGLRRTPRAAPRCSRISIA